MTVPSAAERTLMNVHPQRTQLYLSIFRPQMALMVQASDVYDSFNQQITYDTVLSGSVSNVHDYDYQVALIGTTPGADNLGRTWVRSTFIDTDDTLKIRFVESDHINWQENCYITVLEYIEIIPVFPRIIQDPDNEENVIFYKVWDIAYTNQNDILGSFVCMGSHYAGFLSSGTATIYFSASGTFNLLGESLTYSWEFEGATVPASAAHTPGNVTWTAPGHYRVALEVTSASGRVDRSVRNISIYNRPGEGTFVPVQNWEMLELSGSRDGVGYSARVRVRDTVVRDGITDGALVVIFKEDWYGNNKFQVNKNDKGREGILFTGYISGDTIHQNYADDYIEFEVLSPTGIMEKTECFSVSVESVFDSTEWYELVNMDVRRAVYHYLAWHSSVPLCCDIEAKNLDDRYIQYFDADRTSLYDAINSVLDGALHARAISDSLGKIWMERDISVISDAGVTLPLTQTINRSDWMDEPVITERQIGEVSFIEGGGIAYNPNSGAAISNPYLSAAPGSAPGYRGRVERIQGFALSSQLDLDNVVGNLYAYWNSRYPEIEMQLRSNYANLDIAPQEKIYLNIDQGDTPRGIVFASKPFALRDITWNWNDRSQLLYPTVGLAEIPDGFAGTPIVIPTEPPGTTSPPGGTQPPELPPPPPVIYPPPQGGGSGTAINVYEDGEFVITTTKLNFIGSYVRVYANPTGRADIMIDGCGCTGTV